MHADVSLVIVFRASIISLSEAVGSTNVHFTSFFFEAVSNVEKSNLNAPILEGGGFEKEYLKK
jgi:hypothetical protein